VGLLLLLSFSAELAIVLMTIGIAVQPCCTPRTCFQHRRSVGNPVFKWVRLASAALVIILWLLVTGISLARTTWTLSYREHLSRFSRGGRSRSWTDRYGIAYGPVGATTTAAWCIILIAEYSTLRRNAGRLRLTESDLGLVPARLARS
jgi:hypothetical protein